MAGGLALYWRPGLEGTQNYITSALGISEQVVALMWLLLSFTWAFVGVLVGYSVSAPSFSTYRAGGGGQTPAHEVTPYEEDPILPRPPGAISGFEKPPAVASYRRGADGGLHDLTADGA